MEDVLAVYALPYDPDYPVVCMDESSRQLIGEVHEPLPAAPGRPARVDHEYVRNGVAQIFIEVEPLAGRRHVAVTERRTAEDWAVWIRGMLDERYPDAVKVRLVLDNLNTHTTASLYQTFEPQEARRLAERLEAPLHAQTRQLVERGRDRTQRAPATVSRPAYSGQGHHALRDRRLGGRPQPPAVEDRLAVHNLGCTHQVEAPVSETLGVTRY
jgi:hypothetical protein